MTPRRHRAVFPAFLSLILAIGFALSGVAVAAPQNNQSLAAKGQATPVEMANNQCNVTTSPTTCGGAWNATQTFKNGLNHGEIVTMVMAYLYGNNQSTRMSFSDKLGNAAVLVSSGCSSSTPIVCTAIGYFLVQHPGYDDVLFTVLGGTAGEIWYNAEIWQGQFGKTQFASGASSYCNSGCLGQLSLGPVNIQGAAGVIALSAYAAFYPSTPATWQPSYPYYYSLTDFNPVGGDSILWQATTTLLGSYSFAATTSPTPLIWGGSAEVIYW